MNYTENFKKCLLKTLKFEGGYSNDPDDPGAETVFGISRKYHPDWEGWNIIDRIFNKELITFSFLKENEDLFQSVAKFYFENFYQKIKINEIEKIFPELACHVFDFAVNAGTRTSAKALQKAINDTLKELQNSIVVDGIIGNQTLSSIELIINNNLNQKLICNFIKHRSLHYAHISQNNTRLIKFLKGWINRAFFE